MSPKNNEIDEFLMAHNKRDPVAELVRSAKKWFAAAFGAWSEEDYEKVAVLAPLAVEHLGKAVLWAKNPVLLVPLTADSEGSLLELASNPDLTSPRLRTIGLNLVLGRLEKILDGLPVDRERRTNIVRVRNGAVHVGSAPESRQILVDCIELNGSLLAQLGQDPQGFYDEYYPSVVYLLDKKRTEVQQRVAAKLARARQHVQRLERSLGRETFQEAKDRLEISASELFSGSDYGAECWDIGAVCPGCGAKGRILGAIDLDSVVDVDVESNSDGTYSSYPIYAGWNASMDPWAFACNVCKLFLNDSDELGEVALPSSLYEIQLDELGDDFDPELFLDFQRYRD
ncbi:MAG: hypothetical protein QOF99_2547 [Pseudonocardiales bacterium]|nr:hypothetical protein [Pseudonocardiales bacterium]